MKIGKNEFIKQLMDEYHYTKSSATSVVEDFCGLLLSNIERGNAVSIYGVGCFDIVLRAEHKCPNPQSNEECIIPAHYVPRFYPGNSMRRAVKKWEDNEARGLNG